MWRRWSAWESKRSLSWNTNRTLFPWTSEAVVVASPWISYPEAAAVIAQCWLGRLSAGPAETRWRVILASSHRHVINCSHECPTAVMFRQCYSLPGPLWWHDELGKRPVMSELRSERLQWHVLLLSGDCSRPSHLPSAGNSSTSLQNRAQPQCRRGVGMPTQLTRDISGYTRPKFQRVPPHQVTTERAWRWWGGGTGSLWKCSHSESSLLLLIFPGYRGLSPSAPSALQESTSLAECFFPTFQLWPVSIIGLVLVITPAAAYSFVFLTHRVTHSAAQRRVGWYPRCGNT